MTPEDYLNHLIEQQLGGSSLPASDEEAAKIAAAAALVRLNTLEASQESAARLKARFRAEMRARQNGHLVHLERPPLASGQRSRTLFRRSWVSALSAAAVLLLACLGVAHAASSSLPGDPLYGVKQVEQQVSLAGAGSPAARARLQISQLQGALDDLETEVHAGRSDDDIRQALFIVATDTHSSQAAVATLTDGADQEALEQSLAKALQEERATVYRLLAPLDWPLRVAFTGQLGAVGAPVPTLTQVTFDEGSGDSLTLKLTGSNFAPGAVVVINGTPRGTISQQSQTELAARLNASDWPGGTATVGILNPDGTAAQLTVTYGEPHGGSGDGDDQGAEGTPGPTSTPGSGDGHDGNCGSSDGGGGSSDGGSGGSGISGGTGSSGGGSSGGGGGCPTGNGGS
jgi:hypothetical protein